MKRRERKPDMTKVACAVLQGFVTCAAGAGPAGGSQARVKRPMTVGHAPILDIVQ